MTLKLSTLRDRIMPADSLLGIDREDFNKSVEIVESEEHTYLKIIGEEVQSIDSKLVR